MRERPLWAIATDSLANQLLTLGRALGDVAARDRAGRHRWPRRSAPPLPAPRYVDVGRRAVHPAGVVLPAGRPAARRGDVHVVPAPSARRAAALLERC